MARYGFISQTDPSIGHFEFPEDITGKNLNDLGDAWSGKELERLLKEVLPQNKKLENYKIDFDFPNAGRKSLLVNASILTMENSGDQNILLAIQDITAKTLKPGELICGLSILGRLPALSN